MRLLNSPEVLDESVCNIDNPIYLQNEPIAQKLSVHQQFVTHIIDTGNVCNVYMSEHPYRWH